MAKLYVKGKLIHSTLPSFEVFKEACYAFTFLSTNRDKKYEKLVHAIMHWKKISLADLEKKMIPEELRKSCEEIDLLVSGYKQTEKIVQLRQALNKIKVNYRYPYGSWEEINELLNEILHKFIYTEKSNLSYEELYAHLELFLNESYLSYCQEFITQFNSKFKIEEKKLIDLNMVFEQAYTFNFSECFRKEVSPVMNLIENIATARFNVGMVFEQNLLNYQTAKNFKVNFALEDKFYSKVKIKECSDIKLLLILEQVEKFFNDTQVIKFSASIHKRGYPGYRVKNMQNYFGFLHDAVIEKVGIFKNEYSWSSGFPIKISVELSQEQGFHDEIEESNDD